MKFLVADDHELFLKGLELLLKTNYAGAEIVLTHNYTEIFEILERQKKFDLILTDLAMPGDVWSNAIKKIHDKIPETPIIILSAVFDREIVQKTIELGVSGYLSKTSSHDEIINALQLVLSGGAWLPQEFLQTQQLDSVTEADKLLQGMMVENVSLSSNKPHLTPRQKDVLEEVAAGKSNKVIAFELGMTEGTVKLHMTAILKILGVYNRTAAVMEATKLGLIKGS